MAKALAYLGGFALIYTAAPEWNVKAHWAG
jgi:hypothetical protein